MIDHFMDVVVIVIVFVWFPLCIYKKYRHEQESKA
ncbi:hypothetical protein LCGC14_3012250 [marine sediment metagenome]|uniref:Uncharacterized protein n=1 Tax=marine sediment metagenome TaxID=412755 RepID=A0A0F8WXR5_9ZZZZ